MFFVAVVAVILLFDFHQHKQAKEITLKESTIWVVFYMFISFLFAGFIYARMGAEASMLFLTGWGLEKALAVDNLIVFAAIFSYFNIKDKYQHRILYLGVLGAIVLRLIFVSIGIGLAHVIGATAEIIFGLIILYTAYLMYTSGEDEPVSYYHAWYIKLTMKWLPTTPETDGGRFFINGKATIYLFALIAIEISDIMFAFDSVPVIISVTKEPFLVYSSMIFAILGLRSMYFVLSALVRNLIYFETAVIVVLIFIAAKLFANALFGFEISPATNLITVLIILTIGVLSSKIKETCYEH